jgi:hypothetical protein
MERQGIPGIKIRKKNQIWVVLNKIDLFIVHFNRKLDLIMYTSNYLKEDQLFHGDNHHIATNNTIAITAYSNMHAF